MTQHEPRGHLVANALAACPNLTQPSPERDALWLAVRDAVCTRGLCLVTPLGSTTAIPVTSEHATGELLAAMEWIFDHERQARAMAAARLYVRLRGVATRGGSGSARMAQADALHGLTNVSPGDPVVFVDDDQVEVAS